MMIERYLYVYDDYDMKSGIVRLWLKYPHDWHAISGGLRIKAKLIARI